MIRYRHLWIVLSLLLWLPLASAHDVWIKPVHLNTVSAGDLVHAELWQGHLGSQEVLARNDHRLLRFEAIGPDGQTFEMPGLHAVTPAGIFRPASAGVWTLVYEGRPVPYSLPPARFEGYLEEEGLSHVAAARKRQGKEKSVGRELVSRSLKSLLTVDGASLEDRSVGLPVELVFSSLAEHGDQLEMLLLEDGKPAANVLIDLIRLDIGAEQQHIRTDTLGRARFVGGEGVWMAAAVVSRALEHPEAEWRTTFTTLTFSVGP